VDGWPATRKGRPLARRFLALRLGRRPPVLRRPRLTSSPGRVPTIAAPGAGVDFTGYLRLYREATAELLARGALVHHELQFSAFHTVSDYGVHPSASATGIELQVINNAIMDLSTHRTLGDQPATVVEHSLGKGEVPSSNLGSSTTSAARSERRRLRSDAAFR
jgi:hypothetical protein